MTSHEIKAAVLGILAEQAMLETDDVAAAKTLDDIGIDSLGLVESIFALEERFDISIPFNANDPQDSPFDISTIDTIVAAAEKLVKDQSA